MDRFNVETINKLQSVKRGEVYWCEFEESTVGSEQNKTRPVLIIQNDKGNKYSPTTIVAIISSKLKATHLPTHIRIDDSCGLNCDSQVELEQIKTVDKRRLTRYVGKISPDTVEKVNKALLVSVFA